MHSNIVPLTAMTLCARFLGSTPQPGILSYKGSLPCIEQPYFWPDVDAVASFIHMQQRIACTAGSFCVVLTNACLSGPNPSCSLGAWLFSFEHMQLPVKLTAN